MKFVQSDNPHYNPGNLFDVLQQVLSAKNDAALARILEISPPVISKVRRKTLPVAPALMIRMHEMTGLSIRDLRKLAGDFREHTGPSAKHPTSVELAMRRSAAAPYSNTKNSSVPAHG